MDAALPLTASRCAILLVSKHKLKERASTGEVTIIGVDLAKNVFQVHGAAAVIRWASRGGAPKGSWLARMLERKPIPVVAVALANKMARGTWAMLTRGESYRGPVLIGA